jgi:hypothetical protein
MGENPVKQEGSATMSYSVFWLIAVICAAALYAILRSRRTKSLRFRALLGSWGKPATANDVDDDAIADIAQYWQTRARHEGGDGAMDDVTWNDLEMDAVFRTMNATRSTPGEETLYAMLRQPDAPDETLAARRRFIRAMDVNGERRTQMLQVFRKLGKRRYHGASAYLYTATDKRPRRICVYYLLAAAPALFIALGCLYTPMFFGLMAVFFADLVAFYVSGKRWMPEITAIRHIASVVNAAGKLARLLPPELEETRGKLQTLYTEMKPVLRWNLLFAMQRQSDMDFLTDYFRITLQLDMICLGKLAAFFSKHRATLCEIYRTVGEADALIAVAEYRAAALDAGLAVCEPEFTGALAVRMEGLRHPLVNHPVPNDMDWNACALVTGSNASGKSTFLKAAALNLIFAQTICVCTASRFRLPRAKVFTSMALRDNVRDKESYFVVEIRSLRRILAAAGGSLPTFCFIDEILRGTNTEERIAAASATLRYLAGQNCLCMAATHDYELIRLLAGFSQYHFQEEAEGDIAFTYKLLPGPTDSRNAIALLTRMDFPEKIVRDAQTAIGRFHETGRWTQDAQET